jgi:hypothetical protein
MTEPKGAAARDIAAIAEELEGILGSMEQRAIA